MKTSNEQKKQGEKAMEVEISERYVNPYTDFGFKKLFGTELNKDLLISFLNALFNDAKREIKDVQYLNAEQLGDGYGDRRAVFDVYCVTEDGSRFIVEMQKAEQEYFKDRSVYYATAPIREQAPKGKWDYHLEDTHDNHVFYDKLTFVYLEMPKFNKREDELETMFDKWMFALRNLSRLLERPAALQERIFKRLFDQAEIAQFSPAELREYAESVKDYWDYYSTMKTAHKKGKEEGRAEERIANARNLKANGVPAELIAKSLNISIEEIDKL